MQLDTNTVFTLDTARAIRSREGDQRAINGRSTMSVNARGIRIRSRDDAGSDPPLGKDRIRFRSRVRDQRLSVNATRDRILQFTVTASGASMVKRAKTSPHFTSDCDHKSAVTYLAGYNCDCESCLLHNAQTAGPRYKQHYAGTQYVGHTHVCLLSDNWYLQLSFTFSCLHDYFARRSKA